MNEVNVEKNIYLQQLEKSSLFFSGNLQKLTICRDTMNLNYLYFIIIFYFLSLMSLFSESLNYEAELLQHIQRSSEAGYKSYIKNSGGDIKDHNGWREIISSTFRTLSEKSGHEAFPIVYSILKNNDFNAFAFPSGQFVIHTGTLDTLDKEIGTLPEKEKSITRTNYMAAILSHELAHYYNSHTFNAVKKALDSNGVVSPKTIQFQQDDEIDADTTAYLLMKKAGYDTNYLMKILKILNNIRQESLEASRNTLNKSNVYFSTHPSPHERMAHMEGEEKELHKFAASMEKIYSDVQLGKNLEGAVNALKKALIKYEDNPELLKILAIAYHKLWEKSVTYKDLQVKSILDVPAFRDKMIFVGGESKKSAVKKIPGDKNMYYKALEAYKKVYNISPENYFLSNYSVLLSYGESEKDEREAIEIAENLFKKNVGIQFANNLGVVYLIARKPKESLDHFRALGKSLEKDMVPDTLLSKEVQNRFREIKESVKLKTQLDPDFIYLDSAPILNLALVEFDYGDQNVAKKLTESYFRYFDSVSKWSNYLSEKTGIPITLSQTESFKLEIAGIKPGDTIKTLLNLWKQPDRKETLDSEEVWFYSLYDSKISLVDGIITEIEINGKNAPPVSRDGVQCKVGMPKENIDEVMGEEAKKNNNYSMYYRYGTVAVQFRQNKMKSLTIYR